MRSLMPSATNRWPRRRGARAGGRAAESAEQRLALGDESGRREIYVRAFPGGEGTLRISPNGGDYPRWSPALLQNAGR